MKNSIYLVLAVLSLAACNKELGKLPENAKVDGNTIIDQRTAKVALNGAYYRLANVDATNNVTDWQSNEIYPAFYAGYMGYGYGELSEELNLYSAGSNTYWTYSYNIINAANGVINAVEALSDDAFTGNGKAEILGEARFLRAYGHFKLLSYYAEWFDLNSTYGVLLRDQLVSLGNIQAKRSTVAESYAFINADLDDAVTNAPDSNSNFYATKWAAMALKMRVLLAHGQTADHTEAVSLANKITGSGKYALEANVIDLFRSKGLSSKEVILGIKSQQNQESYYYNTSKQYWPGASSLYVAKTALRDLYNGDPRQSWMIGDENTNEPGTYYFLKYIAQGSAPTALTETAYTLRLSEVILLKAEAIVRSGGNLEDARNLVKEVMGHAGVTDFSAVDNAVTPAALLTQIYLEISRSLVGEDGQEWMALLRLPFEQVKTLRPTIENKIQYILPVPRNELLNNPAFGPQNPGYEDQ
ncbi:MAG: RagB/SusD family nutrient uptake outer membrane protein [Candidatus Pseudobacter hemicellulosilyticus]|uniref:RagB/SusD family nutrient uptake outer membrane protein n=1 Tax=Candidatus Pseudobacter hemicellulosilyticus TaxID=3121375 RepID=A0AAJ6BHX6_9BACT|nr:MAG: RagB/SusD family nutrient uptake outer membrane protein [Pseudobacter sp.]